MPPLPPSQSLNDVAPGNRVRIVCLPSHADLRERLQAMGIRPGVELLVLRRGRPGGILHLAHGLLEFMLRRDHAAEIEVMPPDLPTTTTTTTTTPIADTNAAAQPPANPTNLPP